MNAILYEDVMHCVSLMYREKIFTLIQTESNSVESELFKNYI